MSADDEISASEFHAEQLQAYLKFAAVKRAEALRVVDVSFKEASDAQLPRDDSTGCGVSAG